MKTTRKMPLLIVSGASGVGKSSTCELLFQKETDYLVMESDLLWHERYNTPENHYREYRRLWMRMAANISQIGKPVVLCGCALPEQFELCEERDLFSHIFYLAIVCSDAELERRMKEGRGITEHGWMESSKQFNRWLWEHAAQTKPPIMLLDTTDITQEKAAEQLDQWIYSCLNSIMME